MSQCPSLLPLFHRLVAICYSHTMSIKRNASGIFYTSMCEWYSCYFFVYQVDLVESTCCMFHRNCLQRFLISCVEYEDGVLKMSQTQHALLKVLILLSSNRILFFNSNTTKVSRKTSHFSACAAQRQIEGVSCLFLCHGC